MDEYTSLPKTIQDRLNYFNEKLKTYSPFISSTNVELERGDVQNFHEHYTKCLVFCKQNNIEFEIDAMIMILYIILHKIGGFEISKYAISYLSNINIPIDLKKKGWLSEIDRSGGAEIKLASLRRLMTQFLNSEIACLDDSYKPQEADQIIGQGVDGIVFALSTGGVAKTLNNRTVNNRFSASISPNFIDRRISELMLNIFLNKIDSVNFLKDVNVSLCLKSNYLEIFTFMEKIDGDIKSFFQSNTLTESQYFCIFYQILHALMCIERHRINHCDLHLGNVFYKILDRDVLLHCSTENYTAVFKTNIIIKLADWGRAIKFAEPKIQPKIILAPESKIIYPESYDPSFDIKFVASNFVMQTQHIKPHLNITRMCKAIVARNYSIYELINMDAVNAFLELYSTKTNVESYYHSYITQ